MKKKSKSWQVVLRYEVDGYLMKDVIGRYKTEAGAEAALKRARRAVKGKGFDLAVARGVRGPKVLIIKDVPVEELTYGSSDGPAIQFTQRGINGWPNKQIVLEPYYPEVTAFKKGDRVVLGGGDIIGDTTGGWGVWAEDLSRYEQWCN